MQSENRKLERKLIHTVSKHGLVNIIHNYETEIKGTRSSKFFLLHNSPKWSKQMLTVIEYKMNRINTNKSSPELNLTTFTSLVMIMLKNLFNGCKTVIFKILIPPKTHAHTHSFAFSAMLSMRFSRFRCSWPQTSGRWECVFILIVTDPCAAATNATKSKSFSVAKWR